MNDEILRQDTSCALPPQATQPIEDWPWPRGRHWWLNGHERDVHAPQANPYHVRDVEVKTGS
jgi:hypothetical protein